MNRTVTFTSGLVLVWIIGYLLIAGRSILIPLVIAIFIWHLLNTILYAVRHVPVVGERLPLWLSHILAIVVLIVFVNVLANIISNNVTEVISASSRYQEKIIEIFNKIDSYFHIKILANFDAFIKNLNFQNVLVNIYGVFTTITGSTVLIMLYVVFLFVEQHYFKQKLDALFPLPEHRALVDSINKHIIKDTQTYLGLKTLLSLIAATCCWIIMKWVHLDFAEFWALLIFFFDTLYS